MKKVRSFRGVIWLLAPVFMVIVASSQTVFAANDFNTSLSGVGDGSVSNPFQIATCEQLQSVELLQGEAVDPNDARFIQTGDIDCSETDGAFEPMTFSGGVFDGQGFKIKNLNFTGGTARGIFFQITGGATVKNIHLQDGTTLSGNTTLGTIATNIEGASTLEDCSSNISVTSTASYAGGIAGHVSESSTIQRCSYTGTATNNGVVGYAGGIVGLLEESTIQDSFLDGTVYASGVAGRAGGIAAIANSSQISQVFTSPNASITSNDLAGGLVGVTSNASTIEGLHGGYAMGQNGSGVFAGSAQTATAVNGIYTAESCCGAAAHITGGGATATGTEQPESDYIGDSAATNLSSWGFDSTWQTVDGNFPALRITTPSDSDRDGIANSVENAGPNNGDANNDGVKDSAQGNVSSSVNAVNSNSVILQNTAASGCSVSELDPQTAQEQTSQDAGFSYPVGLLDFTLNCQETNASTTITAYFESDSSADSFIVRKLLNGQYSNIDDANISNQTIGDSSYIVVSYEVTDGGALDADSQANGTIVDPLGIAQIDDSASSQASLANTGQNHLIISVLSITIVIISVNILSRIVLKN